MTTVYLNPLQTVTVSDQNPGLLNFSSDIQPYLNLITSQHKTKPNFMTWLAAALNIVNDATSTTQLIPSMFDIDNAIGIQLDVLGQILGRSRSLNFQPGNGESPTLSDDNYRIALKAKILMNQWDGTIPSIYNIWYSLFSDITIMIIDNQNMSMSVLVDGENLDQIISEMVAAGYIIPKPAGVTLSLIQVNTISGNDYVGGMVTTNSTITLS